LGQHFEESDNIDAAVAAYKRAMELDPNAAEIPAELAALYLRQNRAQDALATAELALKIDPGNHEANRVAGFVRAELVDSSRSRGSRSKSTESRPQGADDNLVKATQHLEAAIENTPGESDPNTRAVLSRLYLQSGAYEKAIPLLTDLVSQEPGWQEGPLL